ncbi:hypothetical protein ABCR94_29395 [Streptomyces sp. 21So2-11]|uniref:hypothetical protein n=1 Tax=Streptomyces sp. 21So2-11 TaxID=3144408 RepID=UPI00321AFE73
MSTKTIVLTTVGAAVALGFIGVVAAPAAFDWYDGRHEEASSYVTGATAKEDRASVPRWLPDEAKDVSYVMTTTGGDRLLKATLPATEPPPICKPVKPATTPGKPALKATWFPKDTSARAAYHCDLYYAYTEGHTLYAWQQNDDWIASNKAATGN